MTARKIIGIVFSIIAIIFGSIFIAYNEFKIDLGTYFDYSLKSYFSLEFIWKIMPLFICAILLYGGLLLIFKPSKSNMVLALFGFTVLEELIFSSLGIISIDFPNYLTALFMCIALLALYIAYSRKVNLQRISFKDGIGSLVIGTLINLSSYYV